jgi:apolipoprotein N-acyltransferase
LGISDGASSLAFAFPEYIFYWCVVIGIAALVKYGRQKWRDRRWARIANEQ